MNEPTKPLPDGWRWVSVGDVCKRIDYGFTASADFKLTAPRFLRITDIQEGRVDWLTVPGCKISSSDEAAKRLSHGDIVFARTGGTTGKSFLISHPPRAVFASYLIRLQPTQEVLSEFLYSFFQSEGYWQQIRLAARGGAQPNVNASLLGKIRFPCPPLPEQQRLAQLLTEQMAAVDRARAAAKAQLQAAKVLPAAYLCAVFDSPEAQTWPKKKLGDVCEFVGGMQPPKFTFKYQPTPGYVRLVQIQDFRRSDTAVYIPENEARRSFSEDDVMIGRYGPPVFQILRGLSGAYNVALMKAVPRAELSREYLYYLLQEQRIQAAVIGQSERSAGQSGVQKEFLERFEVVVPNLERQREVAGQLAKQLEGVKQVRKALERELSAVNALPAALLRQAFNGELSKQVSVNIKFTTTSEPPSDELTRKKVAVAAFTVSRLHKKSAFGRIQLMKVLYLTETHLGIPLGGRYEREAFGPFDMEIYALEKRAEEQGLFTTKARPKSDGVNYVPAPSLATEVNEAGEVLGEKKAEMNRLLDLFAEMNATGAELVATLYAAWNDFLLDGRTPSDEQLVQEVRENWHERKQRFTPVQLQDMLHWMRVQELIPQGTGPHTILISTDIAIKEPKGGSGH